MKRFTDKQKQHFALKQRPSLTIGYIRTGSNIRDTENVAQTAARISQDAHSDIFGIVTETVSGMTGWKNRKQLRWVADGLITGDCLVIYGFSQLGRSTSDVIDLLTRLRQRGVTICDIKNGWMIDERVCQKTLEMMQEISGQVDHEVISMRVTEGLAARRAKGLPLGRKKGGVAGSKLDAHKNEIISLLKAGSTKAYIIKKFKTSKTNLYHWLKQNDLDRIQPQYRDAAEDKK